MQCNLVPLDGASNLGQGTYSPPFVDVLQDVTASLNSANLLDSGDLDLFRISQYTNNANTNMALSFAGNPQITAASSKMSGKAASNSLKQDAIMNGDVALFSQYSELKQTFWLVVPALVLVHISLVVYFCHRESSETVTTWQNLGKYFLTSTNDMLQDLRGHSKAVDFLEMLDASLVPCMWCGLGGCILIALYAATPSVYGPNSCVDPFIRCTASSAESRSHVEWIWLIVMVALTAGAIYTLIRFQLMARAQARQSKRVLTVLDDFNSRSKQQLEGVLYHWHFNAMSAQWEQVYQYEATVNALNYIGLFFSFAIMAMPEICEQMMYSLNFGAVYVMADNSRRAGTTGGSFFLVHHTPLAW